MENMIKVLVCKVGMGAALREIPNDLYEFQKLVDGYIEEYRPFEDDVAIVCNEEGKMMCEPNRRINNYDGSLLDVIFGDFFICGVDDGEGEFTDIPEDLIDKYKVMMDRKENMWARR